MEPPPQRPAPRPPSPPTPPPSPTPTAPPPQRFRAARLLKDKVAAVEVVDPFRVRFRLKEPWPDFMTFYASPATGAGWIVPKKYIEKVGDDGYLKAPVGAGPYKLTVFNPGVELD